MSTPGAQTPAPVFRAEIDLVVVEARVTDASRRPIAGLIAADFTVRVDGVPRRVVAAEYVDLAAGRRAAVASAVRSYSTNVGGEVPRTLLFVVDTDSLPPAGGAVLAAAIGRFWPGCQTATWWASSRFRLASRTSLPRATGRCFGRGSARS